MQIVFAARKSKSICSKKKTLFAKILRLKVDVSAYFGLNVRSRLKHKIWGSFESSLIIEKGKKYEKFLRSKVDV